MTPFIKQIVAYTTIANCKVGAKTKNDIQQARRDGGITGRKTGCLGISGSRSKTLIAEQVYRSDTYPDRLPAYVHIMDSKTVSVNSKNYVSVHKMNRKWLVFK